MPGLWAPRDWLRDIDSEDFQQSADQIIGTVMPAIDAAKSQATDAIQSTAQAGAQAYQQAATSLPKFTIPSLSSLTSGWGNSTSQPSTATDQLDTASTGVEAPTASGQPAASPLSRFTIPNLTSLLSGWEEPKPPETVEFTPSEAEGPAPSGAATVSAPGMPTATPSAQPTAPVALPDRLDTSSRDANLRQWAPALQDTERRTGLRADALAAIIQAENGGGQSPLSANDNNYFSISYVGRPMQAGPGTGGRFARYATPQDSLNDFVDLIQKHYPEAWANRSDPAKFFAGLVKGGYIVEEPGFPVSTWMNNLETGRQHFAAIAPAPAQAGPTAQAAAAPPAPGSQVDDVAQSALDDPDKWALCGPVAAVIAAQTRGQSWTVADAKRIAQAGNLWDASTGMHGLESQVTLLNRMSINAKTGPADQGRLAADAQAGNTPIISTNRHYFVLKGYDPATGRFDTTTTGTALKGGSRWLTLDQISNLGGGIQGAAYIDNPISPTPSVVASSGTSGTASTSTTAMAASRTSAEAPQPTFYRQPLQPTPGADTTPIEDASSPPGASVPGAPPWEQNPSTAPGVGIPPVRDDYATAGSSAPAVAPATQAIPQEDPTAIPRPAYVPPAMPLVTAPEPSPAPPPPSVSGPRFNPLAGQTQPPQPGELPPRNAPPPSAPLIEQPTPTPPSSTAPYNPLANQPPAQPGELPARPGVVEPTPVTEVGAVGAYTRGNAPPPAVPEVVQAINRGETVNPFHWANQVSDAAADQVVQSVGIDPESAQGIASKFVVSAVVNPINWEGGAFSATAEAAARAGLPFLRAALPAIAERFGAETAGRVSTWLASQGSEVAANVAGQAAAGAVTNPEAPGFGAAFGGGTAAVLGPAGRVIGRGVGAVGSELRAGAERAATVEAERAGQTSVSAAGTLGAVPAGEPNRAPNLADVWQAAKSRLDAVSQRLDAATQAAQDAERSGTDAEAMAANRAYSSVRAEYDAAVDDLQAAHRAQQAQSAAIEQAGYGRPYEQADTLPSELEARGGTAGRAVPRTVDDAVRDTSGRLNATAGPITPAGGGALAAVNRQIGSALAGGVTGAAVGAGTDQENPRAGAMRGALIGAGLGVAGHNLMRVAGRRGEGALASLGAVPPGGEVRPPTIGAETTAFGATPGERVRFRFRVVPLEDLVTSHTNSLGINPDFPAELQPRIRERAASGQQINNIMQRFDPGQMLVDTHTVDRGPMIVGPDNVVESGNGRSIALRRLAQENPAEYRRYVRELQDSLPDYGLTPAALEGIDHPVLVRERTSDLNRAEFAAGANVSAAAEMAPIERAMQDAGRLTDEHVTRLTVGDGQSIDQALLSPDNRDVVRAFVGVVPGSERGALLDASGNLNAYGLERLKSALLAKTYTGEAGARIATAFVESTDPGVRNVENAVYASLPAMARSEALVASGERDASLSVAPDVATAIDVYARLKRAGMSVPDYLAQGALFGDRETTPVQDQILQYLNDNARSPRRIRDMLEGYAQAVDQQASPDQVGMFGEASRATKEEVLSGVTRELGAAPADAGTDLGRAGASGEELARSGAGPAATSEPGPGAPALPAADESRQRFERAQAAAQGQVSAPRTPAADIVPQTGGPEGRLAQEGAPEPFARPGPLPETVVPTGGPEGILEAAGFPARYRPNPIIERVQQAAAQRAKRGGTSPNLLEVSQNIRYSVGMLGNPATGILNAVSGPAETGLGVATAAIRTGILEGRPAPVVYMTAELAKGMAEGVINALGTVAGIIPKAVREAPDFRVPLNERFSSPAGKAVGFAIETPGRITTQAPDALFQRGFWRAGRVREAAAMLNEAGDISRFRPDQQVAEIHRLLTDPTPEEAQRIEDGARQFAQELGYRLKADPVQRKLGGLFRHGDRPATSEDSWVAQAHDFVGSHIMPFFSSIYQINKRGLTLVPGVGSVVGHDLPVKEQLARQMVGASLIYFANDYAAKGGITGPGPSDPDKLALLRNQGWEPSSTYVPGVGYVPNLAFGSAAPILNGLGAYHDSQRYATTAEQADPQKFNERIVKDQGRVWAQFPVMQGMASLYTMATQPVRGTTDFLANAGSSYVPAAWKASEVAQDPYNRTTDRQGPFLDQLQQKVIARSGYIPGLGSRQDLPVAQDRFGRPVENPRQGIGAILPRIQQQKDDPAARLFSEAGVDVGLPPTELHVTTYSGTSKQGTSVPVPLTPDEQRRWNTLRGQILLGAVNGLTEGLAWQNATPADRQKFLRQQVELSNEAAKEQVLRQIGTPEVRRRMATPAIQAAS